jgi:hypothetical protein
MNAPYHLCCRRFAVMGLVASYLAPTTFGDDQ